MELYVKQRAFSWRDRFAVKDEKGNDVYFVQGKLFTWGRKLHVYDAIGFEAAFIHAKVFSWFPRYCIEIMGDTYILVKEFTFFKPKFHLEGTSWEMSGDFWAHKYSLTDNGMPVMDISKQWCTWGDAYTLDILDPRNALLCLCVVLAVDGMQADARKAASSG